MNTIIHIFNSAIRELKRLFKDSNLILVLLVAPLAYPALYGSIYILKYESKVPVAIVDNDNSSLSRGLIRQLEAHQMLNVAHVMTDKEEAIEMLSKDEIQAVLLIHNDFSDNLIQGKACNVNLIITPGRMLILGDVGVAFSETVSFYGGKVKASYLAKQGVPIFNESRLAQPIKLTFQNLYNPYTNYGDMILPALFVIILSQLILIGSAALSAREWTDNSWKELFVSKSNNYFAIAMGKLSAICTIFIFFVVIIKLLLVPLFDIRVEGVAADLLIVSILGIMASASFGLFIGTFFRHRITVFAILGFSSYPFFILSGYAWPQQQIPEIMRNLATVLPSTPFLRSCFYMMQMGNPLNDIQLQLINFAIIIVSYSFLFMIRMWWINRKI